MASNVPGYVWYGFFQGADGHGEEARHYVLALQQQKITVKPVHVSIQTSGVESDSESNPIYDQFLKQLSNDVSPDPYIAVWHITPNFYNPDKKAAMNVGRTMFETDRIPEEWLACCLKMDQIWVPSTFNIETFKRFGIPEERLFKLPETTNLSVFNPDGPRAELEGAKRFRFLSCFEWIPRKGWDLLVEAYLEEFSSNEPVILMLKTWSRGIDYRTQLREKIESISPTNHAPIQLLDSCYSTELMPMLYRACHCFVLPSHGEGWGRPYMEAMACGIPTIGTGWGGNLEFMNSENSFLLPYELVPIPEDAYSYVTVPPLNGHQWANPSKEALRKTMRTVYENYDDAIEIGLKGRAYLEQHFSYERIAALLRSQLENCFLF